MKVNQELIDFANFLADMSGEIARKYFRTQATGEIQKDDNSPVTKADREIELLIREEIEKKYPNHGIIGEEYGIKNAESEFTWVLDPIDGTSSFIIGRPIFGTLIALIKNNKPILGILNQPIINERWIGIDGVGSFFNGKKIQSRNCQNIDDAVMCASSSFYFKGKDKDVFEELCKITKYQKLGGVIYGGDCYSYASIASGFIDIVIDPCLQIYDYAALQPIIENAGGIITDWHGNSPNLRSNVNLVACANKTIHEKVIKILSI